LMRVGIPRALLYHHYGERWLAFLDALGVEAVVSEFTTDDIITAGAFQADNETCLPVKVFSGHLLWLKDRVDAVLVPRVVSQERGTCSCPKFMGLPDLARSLDPSVPPILAPRMDLGDRRSLWAHEWYEVARRLGGGRVSSAAAVAGLLHGLHRRRALDNAGMPGSDIRIGVAGHLYNVHDRRVSLGLLERVRGMGATPVTVDDVPSRCIHRQAKTISHRIFWGFERRLVGAVLQWSRGAEVSGIIFVTSFACGPGSIVGALLEDQLDREGSMPFMTITLDEHSAEAGLVTRLEAFVDMLRHSARKSCGTGELRSIGGGGGP
jgi:predicted nucleotide-binding protein (sugar kinase/HSP70/actin superfamily)